MTTTLAATGLITRPGREQDAPFIFNSWLRSYRRSKAAQQVGNDVYYAQHHKCIERTLQRASTQVLVAVPAALGESDTICGYIVTERVPGADKALVVHYVYVKETFRRLGLAKGMLQAAGWGTDTVCLHTHLTAHAEAATMKYGLIYNPYLVGGISGGG